MKSKYIAAALAIFLGGIGAHKFYLGKTGKGILYLVFFWTYIPAILGLIEGVLYLTKGQAEFDAEYNYAVRSFSPPAPPTPPAPSAPPASFIPSTPKFTAQLQERNTSASLQSGDGQDTFTEAAQIDRRPSKSIDNIRLHKH